MSGKSINRSIRIFINGKEVENSLRKVKGEVYSLRREVEGLPRGSEEYVRKSAELRKVTKYWKEMREEISGIPTLFDKLKSNAGAFTTIVGGFLTFTTITSKIRELIDMAAELSDWQANVQKTTGMTRKEVRGLTKDLDELNTRTSREDLLKIAEEGGRIGIPKEEIAAFTKEMDKANVALGDSFDSVEDVAGSLGKLRNLYEETKNQDIATAFNGIGSSLNELGAAGVASEKNIAAFATRVGALPAAFKPAIADAMGLGAAFEESGIDAEVASRSYGILIQAAAKNTAAFAQVMDVSKQEVEDLINTNPVEFFLQFTKSVSALDKDGVKTAKMLGALGINADGVNKIIGAGASANDRFRETLVLANQAMADGTSLTKEFNTKNENLAATIEKIKKEFVEWVTDERVVEFFEGLVNWFAKLIGVVEDTDVSTVKWKDTLLFLFKVFAIGASAMLSYTASVKLIAMWSNRATVATNLLTLAQRSNILSNNLVQISLYGMSSVVYLLTGRVKLATQSWIFFTAAVRANPLGFALSVITAIAGALLIFRKEAKEATVAQEKFSDALKRIDAEVAKNVSKTQSAISALVNTIKDEKVSLDTRKKAYQELIKLAPEFNGYLKDEEFNIKGLIKVYDLYTKRLYAVANAKSLQKLMEEALGTQNEAALKRYRAEIEAGNKRIENEEKFYNILKDQKAEGLLNLKENLANAGLKDAEKSVQEIQNFISDQIRELDESISIYDVQMNQMIQKYGKYQASQMDEFKELLMQKNTAQMVKDAMLGTGSDFEFTGTIPGKEQQGNSDKDKELERRRRVDEEILRQEIENQKALLDAKRKAQDEALALMDEGYEKERQKLIYEKDRRIEDLQIEIEERKKLQEKLNADADFEAGQGNFAGASHLRQLANEQTAIISEMQATITSIEKGHIIKRQQLKFEYNKKRIEEDQKAYERELMNLETRHNNELKAVKSLEDAKKILRDKYEYSEDELNKLKDFEKAKSEIILAQQKETIKKQLEQLTAQQDELKKIIDKEVGADIMGVGTMTTEQLDELILKYQELANAISKIRNPDGVDENGRTEDQANALGQVDILGTSAEEWENIFSNLDTLGGKLAAAKALATAMSQVWSQYFDAQNQKIKQDLTAFEAAANRKKAALSKQLEQGIISQETYNAKIGKLEADLEKKRAEAEYKQQMNDWKAKMLDANVSTALAIVNALASGSYPANIVFAAIVGALGAVQIGMIAKNKPKKPSGYFSGGPTSGSGRYDEYGRELADGPVHAREYVIPEYLRRDPVIARMEDFIEARRRGMSPDLGRPGEGYAGGGETRPVSPTPVGPENENNTVMLSLVHAVNRLNDHLEYLEENPIEAKLTRTLETAKKLKEDIDDYTTHRNKNRR